MFEFKRDYDSNTPLERVIPSLAADYPERYKGMGLKDLADEMFAAMKELGTTKALAAGFAELPHPDMSPVQAYENLVHNNVEKSKLMIWQEEPLPLVWFPIRLEFHCLCRARMPVRLTARCLAI